MVCFVVTRRRHSRRRCLQSWSWTSPSTEANWCVRTRAAVGWLSMLVVADERTFLHHSIRQLIEVFSVVASQKLPAAIPEGCSSKKEFAGCVWCVSPPCATSTLTRFNLSQPVPASFHAASHDSNLRGQRVEIVDYANIAIPIPQIEEMLSHLDAQVAWLVRVRDNTKALLDCHLE